MDLKQNLQLPKNIRYLAIEGVIGAGKSTLVKYLSQHIHCSSLYEDFENNPFLSDFYADRDSLAFQTQVVFLLSRHKQIKECFGQQDMFSPQIVSDYMFAKDKIFASLNLDENEMALYNKLTHLLEKDLAQPDYVVYLQASTDVLLERIAHRNRSYERHMDRKYIESLNECYNSFFHHYKASPLLIINTNEIDFVRYQEDFNLLLDTILNVREGTNYFSPVGSHS